MADQTAEKYAPLTAASYIIALLLVLFPLGDFILAAVPTANRGIAWRFGALGLLSGALFIPTVGIVAALTVAVRQVHRGVMRTIGVVAAVIAVLLLAATILFILDTLQMRPQVNPVQRGRFLLASGYALVKFTILMGVNALVARSAFQAAREAIVPRPASRPSPSAAASPPPAPPRPAADRLP
jgi:hypothetical protein